MPTIPISVPQRVVDIPYFRPLQLTYPEGNSCNVCYFLPLPQPACLAWHQHTVQCIYFFIWCTSGNHTRFDDEQDSVMTHRGNLHKTVSVPIMWELWVRKLGSNQPGTPAGINSCRYHIRSLERRGLEIFIFISSPERTPSTRRSFRAIHLSKALIQ